jgi:hypothetical protein
MRNKNLTSAKIAKNDEFYTMYDDIEKELINYKVHFKDKVVYCNCDTEESNFYKYFRNNYDELGLKGLLRSSLADGVPFESERGKEMLSECDIVVTNSPFSLFREYVDLLMDYNKKFLILGNNNAITYKEVFKYIKNNELWLGVNSNKTMEFRLSSDYEKWDKVDNSGNKYGKVPAISWFTNLEHKKRNEPMILYKEFNTEEYPMYDNYFSFNVDKTKDIPKVGAIELTLTEKQFEKLKLSGEKFILIDADKYKVRLLNPVYGVPISWLSSYAPEQFEIVGCSYDYGRPDNWGSKINMTVSINSNNIYKRILIKHKNQNNAN